MDEVVLSVNVFSFPMKDMIFGQCYCKVIVTKYSSWIFFYMVHIHENPSYPNYRACYCSGYHILFFWRGNANNGFFLGSAWNQIGTQMKGIKKCDFPVINTTCKITSSVPHESNFFWTSVPKAIPNCTYNTSQDTFSNLLVRVFGRLHKPGIMLTTNIRLGLVVAKYIKLPTIIL